MLRRVLRCKVPPATKPGIAAIVSNLKRAISFVVNSGLYRVRIRTDRHAR